jgi:hypothetical protein
MVMAIIIGIAVAGGTGNALAGIGTAVVLTIINFLVWPKRKED